MSTPDSETYRELIEKNKVDLKIISERVFKEIKLLDSYIESRGFSQPDKDLFKIARNALCWAFFPDSNPSPGNYFRNNRREDSPNESTMLNKQREEIRKVIQEELKAVVSKMNVRFDWIIDTNASLNEWNNLFGAEIALRWALEKLIDVNVSAKPSEMFDLVTRVSKDKDTKDNNENIYPERAVDCRLPSCVDFVRERKADRDKDLCKHENLIFISSKLITIHIMVVGECIYCQRIITTFLNKDGSPGTHDGSEQVDCRLSCEDIAASITTNTSDSTLSGKQRACNEVADRDWESYKAWWQVYNKDVVKVDSNDAEIVISKQLEELHTKLEHLNFKGRDYILGAHQALYWVQQGLKVDDPLKQWKLRLEGGYFENITEPVGKPWKVRFHTNGGVTIYGKKFNTE